LFGRSLVSGRMVSASAPVDIDWDFDTGVVEVVCAEDTTLTLATGSPATDLTAGRHSLTNARPEKAARDELVAWLGEQLATASATRKQLIADRDAQPALDLPALTEAWTHSVGAEIVDMITIPQGDETIIAVAADKTVHLLGTDGSAIRSMDADERIRMVHWWPEHGLLLAGCVDEQVIAFTLSGERKWIFTSEMHPDVYKAAKTYWFKSAPGHEGIHGLTTGDFIDGESQCFVGSACTLEIIDGDGQLAKRLVQFWGKVSHFQFVDGPAGSTNLLAARRYNGTNTVAIINNETLDPTPRGFYGVPSGHTYVGGWSSMNRDHLMYVDLDGDGVKEVLSEINGTWNRVTVWDAKGTPLHDASFGPGDRIMAKNMRDLDVGDLDGDGKMEIYVATSAALIVALNNECEKLWATRLSSPPTVLKVVGDAIVVGCESGMVVTLDGAGKMVNIGQVDSAPTDITAVGNVVVLATRDGEVKRFSVGG
ncbi:MAG TPA: FG-GAP-like repeat-containing protein, partial [Armatimonadota bacterium]|nr:FG-GAP-like repeat-containing protein [Armatimonadota bacterium]